MAFGQCPNIGEMRQGSLIIELNNIVKMPTLIALGQYLERQIETQTFASMTAVSSSKGSGL